MTLAPRKTRELRAAAQKLAPAVHIGKAGIGLAAVAELNRHLKKDRLVKVRLLPAATADHGVQPQAEELAAATKSELVEVRGSTAVFWRRGSEGGGTDRGGHG